MGTMDLGSWFTQSSLSIYGGVHVIDNRSKYDCHALMINLWRLYVLKHIVEISTHRCAGVTPECGQVNPPRHTSPFLPPNKGCFLHHFCRSILTPAVTSETLYPHTSYS
jgi:hypothetical protein